MQASHHLKPALDAISQQVDARFDRLFPVPEDPRAMLYEAMRYAVIGGGKRMRPLLVVAACDLFNVDRERALRVACAIELVHVYSLVHDDLPCMDDDDLRRGKLTVHKAFDEGIAVLTGDSLFAVAFELLADEATHEDPFVRSELVLELARASGPAGMAGGQMMDIAADTKSFDLSTTPRLQQLKSGALIGFSVEAGAIMGKVGPQTRLKLKGYARDLGLAFQIADDLLDVEGDPAAAGKALRKDGEANKSTFVSLLGVERARSQAEMLIDQAIHHLQGFGPEADLLRAIARFAIERDR
ncbi:MAG: polyprenyl synthetase family protein [Sandaracinobacter sp.]